MLSTRIFRIARALFLLIPLAACGFTPVYAPDSGIQEAFADIEIEKPGNERSFLFVREMEDRIGRAEDARKILRYNLSIRGEGVESDSERRRFVGAVRYRLVDKRSKKVLTSGNVDSFAGYSVSDGLFISAREDAVDRLVVILADQVTRELYAALAKP